MSIKKNELVRISKGRKVYRVRTAVRQDGTGIWHFYLEADAEHPDAAKRVPDAFRWYTADELRKVTDE